MKKRMKPRARSLVLESLDPRLCLAADIGFAGMAEMPVDHASMHVSHWHNPSRPHDVNQDRNVTPADALVVINTLNTKGARTLSAAEGEAAGLVDVNGDSQVTPADCLSVVNELNQESVGVTAVEETPSDGSSPDETILDDGTVDDGTVDDGTTDGGTTVDVPTGHPGCGDSSRPTLEERFAVADANDDGVLTEDELPPELWERLSAADTDESGGITVDELTAFKPPGGPHGPRHGGIGDGKVLDRFDQYGDDALTEDELTPELWERLAAADTDGDGSITLDELTAFKPEGGPLGPRPGGTCAGDLFDRLDQDDDGLLSEFELPEELWAHIAPADSDGDGSVSSEELAAFQPTPPARADLAPPGHPRLSLEGTLPERSQMHHRGGSVRATPFGGNARRV